jgi:hypothetical protein
MRERQAAEASFIIFITHLHILFVLSCMELLGSARATNG